MHCVSVVDYQWPGHVVRLVPQLDRLGYHRYWATEHHSSHQSASPTIIAALAAGLTEGIRVGTAGILLHFQSPLRVVEDFRLLELFFAQRVDLGVASGRPNETAVTTALLDGRPTPDSTTYADKVASLVQLARGEPPLADGVDPVLVGPRVESTPEIWICGQSRRSAELAGRLGVAYAFHVYLNGTNAQPVDGPSVLEAYREAFRPVRQMPIPRCSVACYGLCAESERQARRHYSGHRPTKRFRGSQLRQTGIFIGTAGQCQDQLFELLESYEADELVIQSLCTDFSMQLDSYTLLAEVFGLHPRSHKHD